MAKKFNQLQFINEASEDQAEIIVEGQIGYEDWWGDHEYDENTNRLMTEELNKIRALKAKTVLVKIHSLGGDVDHALAIYDQLKDLKANVITQINGMCASAATILFAAGSERKISKNALFLVHKCWGYSRGNANQLEAAIESFKQIDQRIMSIYKESGVVDEQKLNDLMNYNNGEGKWIPATEVKDIGFATDIYNETAKAASFSRETFNNSKLPEIPEAFTNLISDKKENWFDQYKDKIIALFSSDGKDNTNTSINQNFIEMKKFPLMVALLALAAETVFEPEKGLNLTEEQLQTIEDKLAKFDSTETENKNLKAAKTKAESDLAAAIEKRDELQAKVDNIPAPGATVNGKDGQDTPKDDFAEYVEKDPMYGQLKKVI